MDPSNVEDMHPAAAAAAVRAPGAPQALRAPRPDRDARALLRWLNLMSPAGRVELPVRAQRAMWRSTAMALGRRPPVAAIRAHSIPGPGGPIELRVFYPRHSQQPLPAFLWCHGGGFMVGDLDTSDSICRSIARRAGCIVVAVRYRLAPEHDLLASREDFLAALEWVAAHGAPLGIDRNALAIGGDSAGGNICAAVAQRLKARGGPALRLQVLVYPATDLGEVFPSRDENAEGYLLTARIMERLGRSVVRDADVADPWLSPRRQADLRGLAPALVVSAGFDPIRDDAIDYTARLRRAGVAVQLLHYAGQFHGFVNFDAVVGAGSDCLHRMADALRAAFAGAPPADVTLEIADAAPAGVCLPWPAVSELMATATIGSVVAARWNLSLFARLLPPARGLVRRLVELRPERALRHAPTARQTHPAAAVRKEGT